VINNDYDYVILGDMILGYMNFSISDLFFKKSLLGIKQTKLSVNATRGGMTVHIERRHR